MKSITTIIFAVIFVGAMQAQTVYQTYIVSGNETWDLITYPNGIEIEEQIIIENGAHLILNDLTIKFHRKQSVGPGIVIEPGGVLEAYGTSFLSRFYYMPWLGIRVKGNPNFPYYDFSKQGVLVMDSCQIESASSAVHADVGWHTTGGGTIVVRNTTFQNCMSSIRMGEAPLGLGIISNCTFQRTIDFPAIWNSILQNSEYVPFGIELYRANARINNCSFTATWNNNPLSGEAAISVAGGDVRVIGNQIHGWFRGLDGRSYDPNDIIVAKDNYMFSRDYNINLYYNTNSFIIDNEFEIWEPARSVSFWQSTNFTFEQNNIIADQWYNLARGVEVTGTGLYNNEIYNNTFENLWFGIYARENQTDEDYGLLLKCNKFTNSRWDIWVYQGMPGEGIYKYQGSMAEHPNAPAGNEFSYLGYPYSDFTNQSEEHIYYVYHENSGMNHKPEDYSQSTITINPNPIEYSDLSCPDNFPPGGGSVPGDANDPAVRLAGMIEAGNAESGVRYLIDQLKDGGNTQELLTNINMSIPPEAYEIYLDLMSKSPYLTKEAIQAAIDKESVISNVMLRDIMVANPQSAKENELLESLDYRSTPMPDHMKAEIWSGLDVASALENLESIRAYYAQKVSRNHRFLVQHYMTDTLDENASKQALTELLQLGIEPMAYYQLAFMHLSDGNAAQGEQLLNNAHNAFELNDYQTAELTTMQSYFQLRKQMQQNGQYMSDLDENQLDALMEIAEYGQGIAKGYACNILNIYGLCDGLLAENLKNLYLDEYNAYTRKEREYERLIKIEKAHQYISISPNPAKDYITVQLTDEVLSVDAMFHIYGSNGKLVHQQFLAAKHKEMVVDVSKLLPGNYSIAMVINGKPIESGRFVIVE